MSWISDVTDAITGTFTSLGTAIINFVKTGFVNLFFNVDAQNTHFGNTGNSILSINIEE